jgi:hypothetical protein
MIPWWVLHAIIYACGPAEFHADCSMAERVTSSTIWVAIEANMEVRAPAGFDNAGCPPSTDWPSPRFLEKLSCAYGALPFQSLNISASCGHGAATTLRLLHAWTFFLQFRFLLDPATLILLHAPLAAAAAAAAPAAANRYRPDLQNQAIISIFGSLANTWRGALVPTNSWIF